MAQCKSCGAEIVWIETIAGKPMPCDELVQTFITNDGQTLTGRVPHWVTCPDSEEWKGKAQQSLF
jgi:hypothetical protein